MKFTFSDTKKYQNWADQLRQHFPTMTQKNMGRMQANMHIRKIARIRKVEFEDLLTAVVRSGLYNDLSFRMIHGINSSYLINRISQNSPVDGPCFKMYVEYYSSEKSIYVSRDFKYKFIYDPDLALNRMLSLAQKIIENARKIHIYDMRDKSTKNGKLIFHFDHGRIKTNLINEVV